MSSQKKVAVIVTSTRTPRVGPRVADLVTSIISPDAAQNNIDLASVDVAKFNLPIYDERVIPAQVPAIAQYEHAHSIAWSKEISQYDAYILVIPEYNAGMAAATKNAIDYLYHEWIGKPVAVVSYGIMGGKSASAQVKQTLEGMRLRVAATRPALPFSGGAGPDLATAMGDGEIGEQSRKAALGAAATSAQLRLPFKRQSYPHSTSGSQELSNGRRSISEVDFFTAENAYLVNVTLGTPPQDLSVLLTVQQAETWVPNQLTCDLPSYSVKYGSCKYSSFMAKNSSSYVNPGDEDFKAIIPEGYAYGKIMKETLSIGGFKLPNFEMGLADRANSYIGTLGLASNTTAYDRLYPSNPTRGKYTPTFLERLLTDGGINSTAYSLWLDDDSGDSGNLLLGAI
ncbi:aspartic proteinase [Colletotrichum truncatum]|uniref:Aspartic proteinase n=1 Tax=Colletotrichum truncatum TaxID=5467 RepID=A0ACC3Z8Q2_COLTU|nr:aspartic proteinase [Colletotrichum truncatum]KAF6789311.1 aspartic proteinase [Colletotrichum truncatum]